MKNTKNNSDKSISNRNKKIQTKRKKTNKYNNMYLYIQIMVTTIFIAVSLMLKVKDGEAFYAVKEDYAQFYSTGITQYSNFSYRTYIENITEEILEKYNTLVETFSSIKGKGNSDVYPDNISLKKKFPIEKGIMPLNGVITSDFGIRKNPFNKKEKEFHTGIDIASSKGSFIKTAFDGVVSEVGYTEISGNYIKVKTSENTETFYGHTQFIFVKENDTVLKGQIIATVGDTGLVTGPHLHFEVIYDGNRVNPKYVVN